MIFQPDGSAGRLQSVTTKDNSAQGAHKCLIQI